MQLYHRPIKELKKELLAAKERSRGGALRPCGSGRTKGGGSQEKQRLKASERSNSWRKMTGD